MVELSHQCLRWIELHLGMAAEAEIRIALNEEFVMDRAMRLVASRTAVLHRLVHEDEVSGLFAMALSALLISTGQAETAWLLEDLAAVRLVAINAVHLAFQ